MVSFFFKQRADSARKRRFSALQKITAALGMTAYSLAVPLCALHRVTF